MKTLVVGAGAMGRWFAEALQEDAPGSTNISFLDAEPAAAADAAAAVDGQAVTDEEAGSYDIVCIAVPIPAAVDAIEAHAGRATEAIVDVTGTMTEPIAAMREHAPDCQRASLHPLFAPANEPGNIPAVIDEGGPAIELVVETLRARGNDVFETTATRHDEMMETVQARTHAAVIAFALTANPVPDRYHTPISSELAKLARQVTGGDGRVYGDIQYAFEGAEDIAAAAQDIAEADRETFEQLYEQAAFPDVAGMEQNE